MTDKDAATGRGAALIEAEAASEKLRFTGLPRIIIVAFTLFAIALTVLPATDLFMTGRDHDRAVPRGVAPAHRFHDAGLCCTVATNNVLNPFTPYGDCSLSRMANLFANVAQLGAAQDLSACFDMVTTAPFRLLGRDPALRIGAEATLVALPCQSRADTVAEIGRPIWGVKSGRQSFDAPQPILCVGGRE